MPRWLLVPAFVTVAVAAFFAWPTPAPEVAAVPPQPETLPKPAPNPDAEQALAKVQIEKGLDVSLWAAEPLLANPVAFTLDDHGNAYVAETTRFKNGVPDTRSHMYWLDEDLAARTVADRQAMYKKHNYTGFEKFDDQVRKVWDSNKDGKADHSSVFSDGYNQPADGLAAGVLARKGNVYLTNIPSLYKLTDADGDHKADGKPVLFTGFGVRAQFLGHDLHGLVMGPDGKLYFSIGDRGLHVETKEGTTLSNPDSGCVLRCEPDGAKLEIVHVGLRNPQELAFDDYGNLFTYDNNSDSGDKARWVQIVEGGDSGWRAGYQYGSLMHHDGVPQGNRGPWNTEGIWHVPTPEDPSPAYIVPPLLHFGNGPAGLTHYPGVGLGDRYNDHFFACDFTSTPGSSKIWSLAVKPKGASFEVVDLHPFVQQMVPTDCEFGPDGAFYWSDWTGGWDPPGKGRIFRVADTEAMKKPVVAEAKALLEEGMAGRGVGELAKLLGYPHQRVRLEAQYELAGRDPKEAIPALAKVAMDSKEIIARLHAIWGLGMIDAIMRQAKQMDFALWSDVHKAIADQIRDPDALVRAAAIRAMGNGAYDGTARDNDPFHVVAAMGSAKSLLTDDDARVRASAARAYGRTCLQYQAFFHAPRDLSYTLAMPLFDLLEANAGQDVYVRQAAVRGLASYHGTSENLFTSWRNVKGKYDTPAVRLGVVLALRKLRGNDLAHFATDSDPQIVTEAARAIYDENVTAALPALAELAAKSGLADPVAYRALAANYRLGTPENAARVAGFVARSTEADHLRVFGLKLLADWPKPPRRDPITGLVHDLPARDADKIVEAIRPDLPKLFVGSDAVRSEAVKTAKALNATDVGPLMAGLVTDGDRPANIRAEALLALQALKAKELADAVAFALKSDVPKLRAAARVVNARADEAAAAKELPELLLDPAATTIEKQMALEVLGTLKESPTVDAALAAWLDRYLAGEVSPELKLDVLDAVQARTTTRGLKVHSPLKEKLAAIDKAARAAVASDPLARNREVLAGGDADRGKAIFLNSAAVSCQRCHKLAGQGGEVGPPLDGVAKDKTRDYLLESIVDPNKAIAKGYDSVLLYTLDGKVVSGVLREKTAEQYTVMTGEGKLIVVPADDVDAAKPDKSAMPDDVAKKLTKRELRDVIEFLAGLKEPAK